MVASAVCLVEFLKLLDIDGALVRVNTFHSCDVIRELRITKIAHVNLFLLLAKSHFCDIYGSCLFAKLFPSPLVLRLRLMVVEGCYISLLPVNDSYLPP